ncbi:hypothetical protein ABT095_07440 [Kitasatospora sp. NPDC002227]|uniref:hypothetical protein n=1 Tax=Kitasatospora sp. NPDC002227 TaxID=3154773 RepID=UPI00331D897B
MAAISARKGAAVAGVLAVAGAAVQWVRTRLGVATLPTQVAAMVGPQDGGVDPPPPPTTGGRTVVTPAGGVDPPPKHH